MFPANATDQILECSCKLGSKITVYAAIVGLVNSEVSEYGKRFINRLHARLEVAAAEDDFVSQKLLMRLSAELATSGTLYMSGLVGLLTDYMEVATNERANRVRRDHAALLVMGTLPWCCERVREEKRDELEDLYTTLKDYMAGRPRAEELLGDGLAALEPWAGGRGGGAVAGKGG